MISVIKKFRLWLDPDGLRDLDTDLYISAFLSIVKTEQYADLNSKKEALDRLIGLTAAAGAAAKSASEDDLESMIRLAEFERRAKEEERNLTDSNTLQALDSLEPIISDINKLRIDSDPECSLSGKNRYLNFKDMFQQHLELMRELEEEALMLGQPPHRPPNPDRQMYNRFALRKYAIPKHVYMAADTGNVKCLGIHEKLNSKNYVHTLQTLVWAEELHQAIEMRKYDLKDVKVVRHHRFFSIPVDGLAERRPSLLRGDRIILKSKTKGLYEGYIHDIREKDILVMLNSSLHSSDSKELHFGVRFIMSRTGFRRCHHAIQLYKNRKGTPKVVFPELNEPLMKEAMIDVTELTPENLRCFMTSLNLHQRRAVIGVLQANCRPAPYIVFGPPGTGKTVTLVESILQVYSRMPSSRILICVNSNSGVDILAQRLLDSKVIPEDQLIRLSAFYRLEKSIPETLKCITMELDSVSYKMLTNNRVMLTTCILAGVLNHVKGSFDYLFIDEAGHSNEPETLISLGLLKPKGCMVLAGDPHQLGPVVMSRIALEHGLALSLLERLSKLDVYKRKKTSASPEEAYDARYITKLLISYRCDPRILKVNNNLFYNNELKFTNETPKQWLSLLDLNNPLVLHGSKGKDQRQRGSPSWFNPKEAMTCLTYAKRLYAGGLKSDQLGIITPYRGQIHKLKLLFNASNLEPCKIATMEEFQGDEREVIIISMVRTDESNMESDKKFNLGFLFNEKRFNVGVSRAKWLVIVIGDPDVLNRDTCWSEYIKLAQYLGDPPTKKPPSDDGPPSPDSGSPPSKKQSKRKKQPPEPKQTQAKQPPEPQQTQAKQQPQPKKQPPVPKQTQAKQPPEPQQIQAKQQPQPKEQPPAPKQTQAKKQPQPKKQAPAPKQSQAKKQPQPKEQPAKNQEQLSTSKQTSGEEQTVPEEQSSNVKKQRSQKYREGQRRRNKRRRERRRQEKLAAEKQLEASSHEEKRETPTQQSSSITKPLSKRQKRRMQLQARENRQSDAQLSCELPTE